MDASRWRLSREEVLEWLTEFLHFPHERIAATAAFRRCPIPADSLDVVEVGMDVEQELSQDGAGDQA
jgi:acyl carrier protein